MNSFKKKQLIAKVGPLLKKTGVHHLFRPLYGGIGHILMFHRVVPESNRARIHNHLSLEVSPTHLEEIILHLKRKKYRFISLDEMYEGLVHGTLKEKFIVVTFDDGYRDNLEIAYPILKKLNVPFTIYIATQFPDKGAVLWWYMLEESLLKRSEVRFTLGQNNFHFHTRNQQEKEQAFSELRSLINQTFDKDRFNDVLSAIFADREENPFDYVESLSLNWEEIAQLSTDPLLTIGAHTIHHYPLTQLSDDELLLEMDGSRKLIADKIGKEVHHFAYPFGKPPEAGLREFECAKHLNFKTATTTRVANVFPAHKDHLECLPRVTINRVTDKHILDLQMQGFLPFIVHKGKRVVTN